FKTILYPFIHGQNGYERPLTDEHWRTLGATLRQIHTAVLPPHLASHIRQETFSPQWRDVVRQVLAEWVTAVYADPIARDCAAFLQSKRAHIADLTARAEELAEKLRAEMPAFTVCHADIHAGNVLISDEAFYVVDWDTLLFAPKERDLMFAGAGLFGHDRSPAEEETLFYQGYGQTEIDYTAVAYYRHERIIEDIAIYCQQLLLTHEGGEDRAQSLTYLKSNFLSGSTIEIADHTLASRS
ncbi:MAG TPA: aminoglycoside phosphotransferase family protein, partial [Chloroflexota bacterium]|nr:aminoglycoside phosphotransferase family protein [Chloroflexota bacterium]